MKLRLLFFAIVAVVTLSLSKGLFADLTVTSDGGASNITATSAALWSQLTVTNGGGIIITNVIYWGPSAAGNVASNWPHALTNTTAQFGKWSTNITGLTPVTIYHYKASAFDRSSGQVWADDVLFTTKANAPTSAPPVTTATSVMADSNDVLAVHTNLFWANVANLVAALNRFGYSSGVTTGVVNSLVNSNINTRGFTGTNDVNGLVNSNLTTRSFTGTNDVNSLVNSNLQTRALTGTNDVNSLVNSNLQTRALTGTNDVNSLVNSNLATRAYLHREGSFSNLTAAGAIVADALLSNSNRIFSLRLIDDISFTLTNQIPGQFLFAEFIQDDTGGHTCAWDNAILWENSTPLEITTNANHASVVRFLASATTNGTFWIASVNGTNYNFTGAGSPPTLGAALVASSGNYLAAANDAAFATNIFTAEAWVTSPVDYWMGGSDWVLTADGGTYLTLYIGSSFAQYHPGGYSGWNHIAATFDGSTATVFLNGTNVATGVIGSFTPGNAFTAGNGPSGGGSATVDEVLFTYGLKYTADFVPETCPTNWVETVLHWKFNEGVSPTIDQSGNGHDGSAVGSPTWTTGECLP